MDWKTRAYIEVFVPRKLLQILRFHLILDNDSDKKWKTRAFISTALSYNCLQSRYVAQTHDRKQTR